MEKFDKMIDELTEYKKLRALNDGITMIEIRYFEDEDDCVESLSGFDEAAIIANFLGDEWPVTDERYAELREIAKPVFNLSRDEFYALDDSVRKQVKEFDSETGMDAVIRMHEDELTAAEAVEHLIEFIEDNQRNKNFAALNTLKDVIAYYKDYIETEARIRQREEKIRQEEEYQEWVSQLDQDEIEDLKEAAFRERFKKEFK